MILYQNQNFEVILWKDDLGNTSSGGRFLVGLQDVTYLKILLK